jgi:hypothetical protein
MLRLRKIPLHPLIEILQDLYESGADFIDLSGEQSEEGEAPKDTIQITIKPEYMLHDERDDDDEDDITQEIELDYSDNDVSSTIRKTLSEDDINDLI